MTGMDIAPIQTGMRIRRERRYDLRLRAEICGRRAKDQAEIIHVDTKNISSLGAYFLTEALLPLHGEVEVKLYLPFALDERVAAEEGSILLTGFVVRTDDAGMAIAFHEDAEFSNIFSSNAAIISLENKGL